MIELNRIYNEDCLEGMKRIPDGSIDAIICDLPYGTTANKWDTVIPFEPLWIQYKRVIKPNGAIVLFSQQPFTTDLIVSNRDWFRYEWIWEKTRPLGYLQCNKKPLRTHENLLVFYGNPPTYNPQKFKVETKDVGREIKRKTQPFSNYSGVSKECVQVTTDIKFPRDVIKFSNWSGGIFGKKTKESYHPTQKPVDIIRYLVRTYTNEGETVLDNCMGSGTTAIACIREHRNFIGFETDKEYFEKSLKRIEDEQKQTALTFL